MARKKVNTYWELIRKYRECPEDEEILEETLGLYCSKGTALNEKEIYIDTEIHEVEGEETVELKIRKFKETIEEIDNAQWFTREEVDMISIDEFDTLAKMFESETYG